MSPITPAEVKATIPDPTSNLCGNFTNALLKLPVLFWKFVNWMLDASGNFSTAFVKMLSDALLPAGTVIQSGSSTVPTGFLLCNGQAVPRATYPELFAAIGTAFGAGDGSSTFNVPNIDGKFIRGAGVLVAGATGGAVEQELVEENIPQIKLGLVADSGAALVWNADNATGAQVSGAGIGAAGTLVAERPKIETEAFGEAEPTAVPTLPPYVALWHFIKT